MSESVFRMAGLALMALGVFMILFGLHVPFTAPLVGAILAWAGLAMLLVGSVMFLVVRKR